VTAATTRQARTLNTNTRYLTDESIEYAERLTATAHPSLSAVLFVNSGSEANDVAWRMAKVWTGHGGGLCMESAYHGITDATDAFSPANAPKQPLQKHMRSLPPPDDYRGPYRRGERNLWERYSTLAGRAIRDLARSEYGVAALMIDSAFMSNGILEVPANYVQSLCSQVRAAGGLYIADEVQAGFGRLGNAMWGYAHHELVPDFVTIGKPAGNGHPIGAVLTRPEILERFTQSAAFFSTFGGNNVSCAAGIAVLDVIRDQRLVENASNTGTYLKAQLRGLMGRYDVVGDVRGSGLALGVDLVFNRKTQEPGAEEARHLIGLLRDEGVLVGSEGPYGNVIKIRPPIVMETTHADTLVAALDKVPARELI
jgi:4-aminobutyrate aminotransferase-like enzyme